MGNIYGTDSWCDPQLLFGPYSSKFGGGVQKCSYDGPGVVNCAYHEMNSGLIVQAHGSGAEVYPSIGECFCFVERDIVCCVVLCCFACGHVRTY